ncbi:acyltransferase family protein [Flavobacterium sp. WC2509]|uniref:acyltransferase family protein n=1 Tax=Flavobacterium sp. WC2509 TaxID=3461406 RepID=UPI004044893E
MDKTNTNRIAILDGFRAIAIVSVILFHYFYLRNDSKFPYFGGDYFHYGFKGVPFFFMISGFVIFYTLENTVSFKLFWKKRFIRLFPSVFIASVFTFVFLLYFDHNQMFKDSGHLSNLIISLTFLPPNFFNWVMDCDNCYSYLNSDYWSLWPEIQFYLYSSTIYFFSKKKIKRNFAVISLLYLFSFQIIMYFNFYSIPVIQKIFNLFNLIKYLPYFVSGSVFYFLYQSNKNVKLKITLILILFVFVNLGFSLIELIASSIMFGLFLCFIFYPKYLVFFENKWILRIGISSYFLYLIHDNIGSVWKHNIVSSFYPYSFIAPVLMGILMFFISDFYTQKIEPTISMQLKKYLLKWTK